MSSRFLFLILFIFQLAFIYTSCKKKEAIEEVELPNTEVVEPIEEQCNNASSGDAIIAIPSGEFTSKFTSKPITIDGCSKDSAWSTVDWYDLNYKWMGNTVESSDYYGKFKLLWDANFLYLFVEVEDDSLNQTLANGLENYWQGDYVEVFIDEDQSGGDHKFNHQAFAYHVSTEGHAIDKNTQEQTVFFDDHITVKREKVGNTYFWEMAILLFDDTFDENSTGNNPVTLINQKKFGFSLAYGDNDGNNNRENFMGSKQTHGINNDEGYINADVFGSVLLVE